MYYGYVFSSLVSVCAIMLMNRLTLLPPNSVAQAFISFTTLLLGCAVVLRARVSLHEKEKQVIYVGCHTDPPDIEIINHKSRRRRAAVAMRALVLELLVTVIIHPLPGYKRSITVKALTRDARYEFESLIVIFMFGRFWHLWVLLRHSLFRKSFEV